MTTRLSKGWAAGIEDAQKAKRLPAFPIGEYIAEVTATRLFISTQSELPTFIAEFKVIKSSNPDVREGSQKAFVTQRNPKFKKYFLADIKNFVSACFAEDENNIDQQGVESAIDSEACVGQTVRVVATENTTNPEYTRVFFEAASESAGVAKPKPKTKAKPQPVEEDEDMVEEDEEEEEEAPRPRSLFGKKKI